MGVNKVQFGDDNNIVMDITDSTVNTNNLLNGEVAYGADGNRVVGSVVVPDELNDLTDVTISSPTNGQILQYNNTNSKWENANLPQGGHVIKNDTGTSMTDRSNLQFQGTYVSDDSSNDKTVVPIIRTMLKSQFDQLSTAEKKGLIDVTDEQGHTVAASDVGYGNTDVDAVLDELTDGLIKFAKNGVFDGNMTLIDTWNSASDVEDFLTEHEVSTGKFTGLKVGQRIKINDGTYNKEWFIAGFDLDYKLGTASSSPYYISQHHICLIPTGILANGSMNGTATTSGGYKGSVMYTTTLPAIATTLQTVLSTHLLEQCLEISSLVSSTTGTSQMSERAKQYISLMTECQVFGFSLHGNKFDNGWNTMKLPIFNFIHSSMGNDIQIYPYWLRSVAGTSVFADCDFGRDTVSSADTSNGIRPYIVVG